MKLDEIKTSREKVGRANEAIPGKEEESLAQQQAQEEVLKFAQRIKNGEAHAFDFLRELPDSVSTKKGTENVWTRKYRAIFDVARERPELAQELGEMEGMISQNPQMLHPSHLIDIASKVIWDPRIDSHLKSSMVHGLGYALRFMQSDEYEKSIAKKLDFSNTTNFSDTAHFLEFMQDLYNIGDDYSYDGDNVVISRVRESLQQAIEKKQGSYLLNVRGQELLAEMDGSSWVASGFDRVPFLITKDRYARHREDGLYVSAPEEQEHIEGLIADFETLEARLHPPQELVDAALARGEREVWWTPDQDLMRERSAIYKSIDDAFTRRLSYEELAPEQNIFNTEQRLAEGHDFAYLQRKPIRERIKNDFEIELSNLSLQDQYKLLRVLKTVEYGKTTPLLLDATRALWKTGVKDYLGEIRGGAMELRSGDISSEDKQTIMESQEAQYSGKYPLGEMEELRESLAGAFENTDSRFYLYRKDGEIVTSARFENRADGNVYMGSFITSPKYAGGAMGQALLEVALQKELAAGPIHGVCDPSLVPFYERFGFRLARGPYKDGHGVDTCDIVLESQDASSFAEAAE